MTVLVKFIRILMAPTVLLASACSTVSTSPIRSTPQDLPQYRVQSYDPANLCVQKFIRQSLDGRNEKILFLIGGMGDLTKNERDWTSGPLSFAGADMLTEQLSRYGGRRVVLQGVPSAELRNLLALGQEFGVADIMKLQRQYDANRIFLLTGGFLGYDQSRSSNGTGVSGGYRDDKADVQAERGKAAESGRIDFLLKVTDPMTNRLMGTISLSGNDRRRTATTKFTLEVRGVGFGFASQNVEVDGPHNVQSSIIAAAHFYLWQMLLPGKEASKCLYEPSTSPSRFATAMSGYEAASPQGKIGLLQRALNRFFGTARAPLVADGKMGPATWLAVGAAERQLHLTPAARGDFGTLYAQLQKFGVSQ